MLSTEEVQSAIEGHLKSLANAKDSKVIIDAYIQVCQHIIQRREDVIPCLEKHKDIFFTSILRDVKSNDILLKEAALQPLGHVLSVDSIVTQCSESLILDLISYLSALIKEEEGKTTLVRSLWCFSKQVFPRELFNEHVQKLVQKLKTISLSKDVSATVVKEVLEVIDKLCLQCPEQMKSNIEDWCDIVFSYSTSCIPKNRELSVRILQDHNLLMLERQDIVSKLAVADLNKDRVSSLETLFKQRKELHVLNVWTCFLKLIGKEFFTLRREIVNTMLKQATSSLAAKQLIPDVIVAWNHLWRSLIDTFAQHPSEFESKLDKVLMKPLYFRPKVESCAVEILLTGWHLICKLPDVNLHFEKIVIPILDKVFPNCFEPALTEEKVTTTPKREVNGNETCITPLSRGFLKSTSHAQSKQLKSIGVEILGQLLQGTSISRSYKNSSVTIQPIINQQLSSETTLKHWSGILACITDASMSPQLVDGAVTLRLWSAYFAQIQDFNIASYRTELFEIFSGIIKCTEEVIVKECQNVNFVLKILAGVPEKVLAGKLTQFQNKSNENGSVGMHILRLLFNDNILKTDWSNEEMFFVLYERILSIFWKHSINQLTLADFSISLLRDVSGHIKDQSTKWRLWSTLTHLMYDYVNQNHDVNQGSTLKYDFTSVMKVLCYPTECIRISDLPDGHIKELMTVWSDLYRAFNSSVTLLPAADINLACEEVTSYFLKECLLEKNINWKNSKSISLYIQMTESVIKNLDIKDFSLSSRDSPNSKKLFNQLQKPLGNFHSLVYVLETICNFLVKSLEQNDNSYDLQIYACLNVMEIFLRKLQTPVSLTESAKVFMKPINLFLKNSFASPKMMMKLEKFTNSLYQCMETNSKVQFTPALLENFSTLLISALESKRKQLCLTTVKFWNNTFGRASDLVVNDALSVALLSAKVKIAVKLPTIPHNQPEILCSMESDEAAQFPDFLEPQAISSKLTVFSPQKKHGSFLGKSPKKSPFKDITPKAEPISPKVQTKVSSPFSSGGNRVRRKLPVGLLDDDSVDYVQVESPFRKKRLLTEHQKDVMREKKVVPVMYNDLDTQSQDASMFNSLTQISNDSSQFDNVKKEIQSNTVRKEISNIQKQMTTIEEKPSALILCKDSPSKDSQMEPIAIGGRQSISNTPPDLQFEKDKKGTGTTLPMPFLEDVTTESPKSTKNMRDSILEAIDSKEKLNSPSKPKEKNEPEVINSPDFVSSSQTQENTKIDESVDSLKLDLSLLHTVCSTNLQTKIDDEPTEIDQLIAPKKQTSLFEIIKANSNSESKTLGPKKRKSMKKSMYSKSRRKSQRKSIAVENEMDARSTHLIENKQLSVKPCDVTISPLAFNLKNAASVSLVKDSDASTNDRKELMLAENAEKLTNTTTESNKLLSEVNMFMPASNEVDQISLKAGMKRRRHTFSAVKSSEVVQKKRKSEIGVVTCSEAVQLEKDIFDFSEEEALKSKASTPKRATSLWKSKAEANNASKKDSSNKQAASLPSSEEQTNASDDKMNSSADDMLPLSSLSKELVAKNIGSNPVNYLSNQIDDDHAKINEATYINDVNMKKKDLDSSLPLEREPAVLTIASTPESVVAKTESKLVVSSSHSSINPVFTLPQALRHTSVAISSPNVSPSIATPSPAASPRTGILKKVKGGDSATSTPNKSRRVSFQLPSHDTSLNDSGEILAQPLDQDDTSKPQAFGKKKSKPLKAQPAIFPDLVTCTSPIEKIIPSLTFSRGLSHIVRAQNILTVGDLSALSENQIENLPIRSPKVATVKNVLNQFRKTSPPRMPDVATPYPRKTSSLAQRETGTPTRSKKKKPSLGKPMLLFSDEKIKGVNKDDEGNIAFGKPISFSLDEKAKVQKLESETMGEKLPLKSEETVDAICKATKEATEDKDLSSTVLKVQPVNNENAKINEKENIHSREKLQPLSKSLIIKGITNGFTASTPDGKENLHNIENITSKSADLHEEENTVEIDSLNLVERQCVNELEKTENLVEETSNIIDTLPSGNVCELKIITDKNRSNCEDPSKVVTQSSDDAANHSHNTLTNTNDSCSAGLQSSVIEQPSNPSKDAIEMDIDSSFQNSTKNSSEIKPSTENCYNAKTSLFDLSSSDVSNMATSRLFELIEQLDTYKSELVLELKRRFVEK